MSDDLYTFDHNGETYTFERPFSIVRSPRWLRANRRRDELDLAFTIMEELAGDDVLDVIDGMSEEEFATFARNLKRAMEDSFR